MTFATTAAVTFLSDALRPGADYHAHSLLPAVVYYAGLAIVMVVLSIFLLVVLSIFLR